MCEDLGEQLGNERWNLKDRVYQIKGILDLHDRNKKWAEGLTKETSKKMKKEMKELAETEMIIRESVQIFKEGDLEGVNMLLRQDPSLELLCKGKPLQECEDIVRQMTFLRRKELDSLVYDLQQKEEDYLKNQYKLETLKLPPKIETKPYVIYRSHEIEADIENALTRQEAAIIVRNSYDKIRKILRKDARCFDTILGGLQLDTIVQCQCVIKAMELGQAAIEDEAALKEKYNKTNKEYKDIEAERERRIGLLKKRITKARNVHIKLQRSESVAKLFVGGTIIKGAADIYTKRLLLENDELQQTMKNLKELCRVTTPGEIFSRAEKMEEKKYRILRQIEVNNTWLKTEIVRKNHITAMNESLLHCVTNDAKQWMNDRNMYESEIIKLKKTLDELKEEEDEEAKVLTDIQLQLTHLYRIVDPVKIGAFKMEVLDSNLNTMERRVKRIGFDGECDSQSSTVNFLDNPRPNEGTHESAGGGNMEEPTQHKLMDVCQLLDVISAKIDIVKTQIGEVDQSDKEMKLALSYYREYMGNRAAYHQATLPRLEGKSEEDMGGVKAKLPTREEMKDRSKRLVAAFKEKPKILKGPAAITVKKHSCY